MQEKRSGKAIKLGDDLCLNLIAKIKLHSVSTHKHTFKLFIFFLPFIEMKMSQAMKERKTEKIEFCL